MACGLRQKLWARRHSLRRQLFTGSQGTPLIHPLQVLQLIYVRLCHFYQSQQSNQLNSAQTVHKEMQTKTIVDCQSQTSQSFTTNSQDLIQIIDYQMLVSGIANRILNYYSTQTVTKGFFQHLGSLSSSALHLTLHQYCHAPTQARIYHFQNQDCERAFASIIKTYPRDSKGTPHILQHLACCGSHKYPIRDPFFNMIRRSVNSYMNAWTGDDFTAYPFASPNRTDWRNLYQVYLDMSMNPLLNRLDFRQEGWRFQINSEGQRELKGIVLNEMKGAYQDSDRQLMCAINQELLRGTPYAFDSGGNPHNIVQLKYNQLKQIYKYYYHPSNMSFYFYGQGSISNQLAFLQQEYLSKYQDQSHLYNSITVRPQPVQQKYKEIVTHTAECNSISISFNFGFTDQISPNDLAALRLVAYLLLEKTNALAYKHFIESGIAQNIGFSGLNEGKITTFTLTLKGIYPNHRPEDLEKQFLQVLAQLHQGGVSQERVKEYLHQLKIKLVTPRETNGIKLLEESIYLMNHRMNFQPFLNPTPIIEAVAEIFSNKNKVQALISKYFVLNQNRVIVRQLMAETQEQQQEVTCPLQVPEQSIKRSQNMLKQRQNEEQDQSVLPTLKLTDIAKPPRKLAALTNTLNSLTKTFKQYHVAIEEVVNFYRLVFTFQELDPDFEKRLLLWMYAINRNISTSSYSYNQLAAKLSTHTAGFNVFSTLGQSNDLHVVFQFSCLKENVSAAFEVLEEIILAPVFDKDHTTNTFKAFSNETVEGLIQNPMEECISEAASCISQAASRINSYKQIKDSILLIKSQDIQGLEHISNQIAACPHVSLIQHSNQKNITTPSLVSRLLQKEGRSMKSGLWMPQSVSKAITHNYSVNFCTQQYPSPKFLSSDYAKVSLLLQVLQQQYLHPKIREQGGAYGSGARIKNGCSIALSSYLDPNNQETFKVFDQSIQDLIYNKSIDNVKLTQAKIMQLAEVDRVRSPQNQGISQILKDYTEEQFENYRQTIKSATFDQIRGVGQKYLRQELSARCVFGRQCPSGFTEERLKDFLI